MSAMGRPQAGVEYQSAPPVPPGLVEAVIEQIHQARGAPHERDVRIAVDFLEELAGVIEGIDAFDPGIAPRGKRLLERLRRAHLARARGGGKGPDSARHAHGVSGGEREARVPPARSKPGRCSRGLRLADGKLFQDAESDLLGLAEV